MPCANLAEVKIATQEGVIYGISHILRFDEEGQVWFMLDEAGVGWDQGPDEDVPTEEEWLEGAPASRCNVKMDSTPTTPALVKKVDCCVGTKAKEA